MVFGVVLAAGAGYLAYRHHQKKRAGKRSKRQNVDNSNRDPNALPSGPYPEYSAPRQQMWDDELPAYGNERGQGNEKGQYRHQQDWEARQSYQSLPLPAVREVQSEKGQGMAAREKSVGY